MSISLHGACTVGNILAPCVASEYRLGDLLVLGDFVAANDLEELVSIASETKMPVGKVFMLSGVIGQQDLNNLLECQALLRKGQIDKAQAKRAIQVARQKKITLNQVMTDQSDPSSCSRHGQSLLPALLLEANLISHNQLAGALALSEKSGLSLGRILILNSLLPEILLCAALEVQLMVRDRQICRQDAATILKDFRRKSNAVDVRQQKGLHSNIRQRLGMLLIRSAVISEGQLISALEASLRTGKPVAEILLEDKLISRSILEATIGIQAFFALGVIHDWEVGVLMKQLKASLSSSWSAIHREPNLKDTEKLASTLMVGKDFVRARAVWSELLDATSRTDGIYSRCLKEIAFTYALEQKLSLARIYQKRMFEVRISSQISEPLVIARAYESLAKLALYYEAYDEAEKCFKEFIRLITLHSDVDLRSLIRGYLSLADVYYAQKKYLAVEGVYKVALTRCAAKFGRRHPWTERVAKKVAIALLRINQIESSQFSQEQALTA